MDSLPKEIIIIIFKNIDYESVINFAFANKKLYTIFKSLQEKEKKICLTKIKTINKFIQQGFRYVSILNCNFKIINIVKTNPTILNIFFRNGDLLAIDIDKNLINYTKINTDKNNIYFKNIKSYLVIESPFNIQCKILHGINHNLHKIMRD